jgi:hypothetical protein
MELTGLDVGFSVKRPSSGVARLRADGSLGLSHTLSTWESRARVIGTKPAHIAAIDAPFTTAGPDEVRSCERVFTFGRFQRRCKPGLSHVPGTGRRLRKAGWETAQQLRGLVPQRDLTAEFPRVSNLNAVEAFPNAFLGVCVSADVYEEMPRLRRGRKFDWLYDCWLRLGLFELVIVEIGLDDIGELRDMCRRIKQHDERAALVCLLTATGVFAGRFTAVGDRASGYLFLPLWRSWAAWARTELDRQRIRLPGLEVWIGGRGFEIGDDLPGVQ